MGNENKDGYVPDLSEGTIKPNPAETEAQLEEAVALDETPGARARAAEASEAELDKISQDATQKSGGDLEKIN